MAKTLDVYLHDDLAGYLIQDHHGEMLFRYAESWLQNPAALPLSHSLPLRKETFSRKQCRGYFAGILPEEDKRKLIARNLGVSEKNDFSILEKIGGECAGAVTFLAAGTTLPERGHHYRYRQLSHEDLANVLRELPRRPLLAGNQDLRLSLAGAQDKIPVHVSNHHISLPLGNAPSTHILKPSNERFEGLVFNEAFCMTLAGLTGLPCARVDIGKVDNIAYLLIERYDRKKSLPDATPLALRTPTLRLHQEDFCQALGVPSEKKYQAEGGPSLKQCFALLRETSTAPVLDIQRLLDAVIFNYLIGNHDVHGKNFSLIYDQGNTIMDRGTRLAPLYDLVCTLYYPDLTNKMAMKIGGEYESAKILPHHFERMAGETGLARPITRKRVVELAQSALNNLDNVKIDHKTAHAVKNIVRGRCEQVLADFTEGTPS